MMRKKPVKFEYERTPTTAMMRVAFPNGEQWEFPAQLVADSRDASYADEEEDSIGFIRAGSLDAFDLRDWAVNNMNWSDVAVHAKKVQDPPPIRDFEEAWLQADRSIVGNI